MAERRSLTDRTRARSSETAGSEIEEMAILVIGKSGAGKSTLINSLFRRAVAIVRRGVRATPHEIVERHQTKICGVNVTLVDTRGLGDPKVETKDIISCLKKNNEEFDLVLTCIKLTERLDRGTLDGIRDISKAYGENFWKRSIVVLTFTNQFELDILEDDPDTMNDVLKQEVEKEVNNVYDCLQARMDNTSKKLLSEVPFCCAGKVPVRDTENVEAKTLCTSDDWPHDVFVCCLERCSEQSKEPMLKIIESVRFSKSTKITAGAGAAGAVVGALIGTIFFPGIGTCIGAAVVGGLAGVTGGIVGLKVASLKQPKDKKKED